MPITSSLRKRALASATAAAILAAAAGPALAASASSDPVVQAIKAQGRAIKAEGDLTGSLHANTPTQARKDAPKIRTLAGRLDHAATVVSQVKAPTGVEKTGQKDWVTGVRKVAGGFDQIAAGFDDFANGNKTGAKTDLDKGEAAIKAGGLLTKQAMKLLHFS